jgi:hypothetical protein
MRAPTMASGIIKQAIRRYQAPDFFYLVAGICPPVGHPYDAGNYMPQPEYLLLQDDYGTS